MPQKRSTRKTERRRAPRTDAHLSMRLEGAREGVEQAKVVTECQNISASGVYCQSTHYLAPLSKVALTIVLPRLPGSRGSQELVKCEGIVVRCEASSVRKSEKGYELACMFSGLDERRRQMLEEFVTWRNLQSLRAAANADGARPTARARKRTSGVAARASAKRATRRRTVH